MTPNILTILRIFSAPILVIVLSFQNFNMVVLGLSIFIISSFTDFLDGYLARSFNQSSKLGKILDPIADKLLVSCALISLVSNNIVNDIHVLAAALIIIREIFISGLREYIKGEILSVTFLAKIKTFTQMICVIFLFPNNFLTSIFEEIGITLLWISALLSIYTGFQYFIIGISQKN